MRLRRHRNSRRNRITPLTNSDYRRATEETFSMNSTKETAELFFDACETGKVLDGCQQ